MAGIDESVQHKELSPEEAEQAFAGGGGTMDAALEGTADAAVPDWVVMPPGLAIPPGRQVGYMMFRSKWTDSPQKGDRQCILWSLTEVEERLAYGRARGDTIRAVSELAKQMVRAVDGHKADWTGANSPGSVQKFWNEIGRRCCQMIQSYYLKTHTLSQEDQMDFFANCFVVRTSVAG